MNLLTRLSKAVVLNVAFTVIIIATGHLVFYIFG